jgi:hypothetical protein
MNAFPDLDEHITTLACVGTRKKMLLFNENFYKPTGEKIETGYRYFACDVGPVQAAAAALDLNALCELPFAIDDEGDADTSSVLVDLEYTKSGSFVAAQAVEYRNSNPTPVMAPQVAEGRADLAALLHELDQSA